MGETFPAGLDDLPLRGIIGTMPFLGTTNAIMNYNSIACKVLTELVLARTFCR